jgi:long-chain acyl-CoA synthetase
LKISDQHSLLEYFYHFEKTKASTVYLKQPINGTYKDFTWAEVGKQVRSLAAYLKSKNYPEKAKIAIISKNCAEWIISDLAIMMAGMVSVPIYPTLTGEQVNQILEHSESSMAIVGKLDNWPAMKKGISVAIDFISYPTYNPDSEHISWTEVMNTPGIIEDYKPKLSDLFTIIYTSGTTGNPKGVMLDFKAFASIMFHTEHVTKLSTPGITFFSYLPLSHIAERNIVLSASLLSGGLVYFAESLDTFAKNLQDASPTHFLAVPRIWTKFQMGILAKLPQKKLDFLLKIPIIKNIIRNKVKKGLGLQNTTINLTGAAPISPSLLEWFQRLGIYIQEAYGMTENVGAVCMMPDNEFRRGSVGKVYPGQEVKIAPENGEILTRASWNMLGYYKEEELTAATIDAENWIHTGDVGELDADGFLKITGRVKEMYKTSKGEYVAPAQIEAKFADIDIVEQVCVIGQNLAQPIAVVVLSELGQNLSKADQEQRLVQFLKDTNPSLKPYERLHKIMVSAEAWTVENNRLTPTLKVKRNILEAAYSEQLEKIYDSNKQVVFE